MKLIIQVTRKCSVCGSSVHETFRQGNVSGIRCLACGHEVRHKDETDDFVLNTIWTNRTYREEEF